MLPDGGLRMCEHDRPRRKSLHLDSTAILQHPIQHTPAIVGDYDAFLITCWTSPQQSPGRTGGFISLRSLFHATSFHNLKRRTATLVLNLDLQ